MGCSTCGGAKKSAIPGGTSAKPIILGEPNGLPAQVATFLKEHDGVPSSAPYRYVSGDGVEQAVEDGLIALGWQVKKKRAARKPKDETPTPEYYVQIGRNRWVGFRSEQKAEVYAKATGGVVVKHDEIIGSE